MFLAFLTRNVAQRQRDEHRYRNRHANAHHNELVIDARVWFACKYENKRLDHSNCLMRVPWSSAIPQLIATPTE